MLTDAAAADAAEAEAGADSAAASARALVGTIDAAVTSDNVTARMRFRRFVPDAAMGFVGFMPASL